MAGLSEAGINAKREGMAVGTFSETCDECKGKGRYVSLLTDEPCGKCGGTGTFFFLDVSDACCTEAPARSLLEARETPSTTVSHDSSLAIGKPRPVDICGIDASEDVFRALDGAWLAEQEIELRVVGAVGILTIVGVPVAVVQRLDRLLNVRMVVADV